MNRARFQITGDFLGSLLSLTETPLSTTLPPDTKVVEVSPQDDGVFWLTIESAEVIALDGETPEIEVFYWGGS